MFCIGHWNQAGAEATKILFAFICVHLRTIKLFYALRASAASALMKFFSSFHLHRIADIDLCLAGRATLIVTLDALALLVPADC